MKEIKKISLLSVAEFAGILVGGIYLVIGVLMSLVYFVMGIFVLESSDVIGLGSGILATFLLALLVGVLSFIIGLFIAWLYNLTAKLIGGIKIELSDRIEVIKEEMKEEVKPQMFTTPPQVEVDDLVDKIPAEGIDDTFKTY